MPFIAELKYGSLRKLLFTMIGVLFVAVVYFAVHEFMLDAEPEQASIVREKSIAVLPFDSSDPRFDYFAGVLREELLNRFVRVPDLMVATWTRECLPDCEIRNPREFAGDLRVSHVLMGSVRSQGNQVRITAQLVSNLDWSQLWSQTYDLTLYDVFLIQDEIAEEVQDEIAEEVVGALDIVLDEEARRRMQRAGIRNTDHSFGGLRGFDAFYRAHEYVDNLLAKLARSMVHSDEGIRLEPDFASAHLNRWDYYAHVLLAPESEPGGHSVTLAAMRDSLDRAFESARDPQSKAIIDIDRVLFSEDWGTLRQKIERALVFDGCVNSLWGLELSSMLGYAADTNRYWETMAACEPPLQTIWQSLGFSYLYLGDAEQALVSCRHALDTLGEHPWTRWLEQTALLALGRHSEAAETALMVPYNDVDATGIVMRVMSAAASGQIAEARTWAIPSNELGSEINLLAVSAMLGDREAANRIAAALDARVGGFLVLMLAVQKCSCGLLFDQKVTPNFAARIAESGVPWPPPTLIDYPAKDW